MGIVKITNERDYQYYLHKYPDNLTMYTGEHCPACHIIEPFFAQLAQQHLRQIFFVVDCNRVKNYQPFLSQLTALPTFVRRREGAVLDTFVGADQNRLFNMINL